MCARSFTPNLREGPQLGGGASSCLLTLSRHPSCKSHFTPSVLSCASLFSPISFAALRVHWGKARLWALGFSERQEGGVEQLKNADKAENVHGLCCSLLPFSCKYMWLLGPRAGRLYTVGGIGQKGVKDALDFCHGGSVCEYSFHSWWALASWSLLKLPGDSHVQPTLENGCSRGQRT